MMIRKEGIVWTNSVPTAILAYSRKTLCRSSRISCGTASRVAICESSPLRQDITDRSRKSDQTDPSGLSGLFGTAGVPKDYSCNAVTCKLCRETRANVQRWKMNRGAPVVCSTWRTGSGNALLKIARPIPELGMKLRVIYVIWSRWESGTTKLRAILATIYLSQSLFVASYLESEDFGEIRRNLFNQVPARAGITTETRTERLQRDSITCV